MDEYLVPSGYGEDEFVEKKSRFIATIRKVETEEEAIRFIEEMKKKYTPKGCFASACYPRCRAWWAAIDAIQN